ncbi:ABC transporter permease [Paenibacillus qinlingensis]|uniref:ABC-2 type transport system permease protein n=1 Tax=Paenibacillus qinlingensis TaxID=1837343 RepID=A0ABU1NX90_9BACL|nr:ABC transporter permease [Paenibacillus qinlingensis]MDR6552106.1 ABC-2 type transport system permease protein [Paenibacillus qinlingensis]
MNSIWTVIKFTYMSRFRIKSFQVMTLILLILVSLLIHLPTIIKQFDSDEATKIGIFGTQQAVVASKLGAFFKNQPNAEILIVPLSDQGSVEANEAYGKQQMADKKIKGYLAFTEGKQGGFPKVIYNSTGTMDSPKNKLQTALQLIKTDIVLQGAGVPDSLKTDIQTPVSLETVQISTSDQAAVGKTESQMRLSYMLVYILLFMLYMGAIGFGNLVATEITAEKSTRVMELLITSVSPLKQMFGKIIGICLLALSQIAALIAVGFINIQLSDASAIKDMNLSWSDLEISVLVYFLIFYLLGFFIYATIFAAVGSLVSRTEDVGPAIMPVTYIIVAAFMIAIFGLNHPNAPFVVTMSFVPFFSPMIMFLRIGMTSLPFWQIALSIAIQLLSIGAMAWLAAKIYRTGVLMYGKRPSLKELRKAMRAYR